MHVSASTYLDALFLLLGDNSDRSRNLVKEFMDVVEKNGAKREIVTDEDELITVYKSLIKSVIAEGISQDNPTSAKILLLKIKTNEVIKSHPLERDLLTDVLTAQDPISSQQIDEYLKRIRNVLIYAEVDAVTKKAFAKSRNISEIQNADDQEMEILKIKEMFDESIKAIERRRNSSDEKKSEAYISMSDRDSIKRALTIFMDRSVKGILRTGLQGMNRSFGKRGGLGRGESIVHAACSHNYKSGILISWMIWVVTYNKIIVDAGKRALVYFVSLENEAHQNLMIVFKALYCRIEQREVDLDSLSSEFVTDWLTDYFKQFDVDLIIERYTPHEFSFGKFVGRKNHFTDQGYEIVAFILDYLSEMRGIDPGDTMSSQGRIQMIAENSLKLVNDAKGSGYLFATGHQLTKKAEEVAAAARYGVKRFNPSMMADSSDVFRIFDAVSYMHLENNVDGHKFLTMQNRKNRGNMDTPEKDKFFAYPFTPYGIEDDLDGLPQYVTDIDAWGPDKGARDENIAEGAMF